jgi:uncharacterized protein Yka (UPF0111/DUF47 family)
MWLHRNTAVFDVLDELADLASISAGRLHEATVLHATEPPTESLQEQAQRAEHLMHQINERLAHAFQSPIDPEDAHQLAEDLGRIVHLVQALAQRLRLYHATPVSGEMLREIEVLSKAAQAIDTAVHLLRRSRHRQDLSPMVAEIRRLKEVGDDHHDAALARLYAGNAEILLVLKETELHDLTETAIHTCKDIANILEHIAVKSA